MPQGVGGIVYLSDEDENFGRVSTAGRAFFSESYSKIKKHSPLNVTAASGGSNFETVSVGRVMLYSESGNGIMWWGGTGDDAPYSGRGMPLWGGERTDLIPVTNFNSIRVVASVSGQIIYSIGFLNGSDVPLSNTSPASPPVPVEFISPLVVSHSPISGLSGVSLNSQITATFNEAISDASVTSGSFKLSPAHNVTVFRDVSDTTTIVMTPNVNLSGSTVYIAGITSQVKDVAGNSVSGTSGGLFNFTWPFTTTDAPDITAPVVSGTSPASGATNVNGTTDVTITFSEPMLSASITPLNIYLSYLSGVVSTSGISGTVSLAVDAKTVTVDPTPAFLSGSSNVKINILSGCRDIAGNNLAAHDRSKNFTMAAADVTAPLVSGTTPVSGATGVNEENDVTILFSEQMLSGTMNSTNIYVSTLSGAANGVAADVTLSAADKKTVTVNPTNTLTTATTYHINVTTGVKDLAGNSMAAIDRSRHFTTFAPFVEIYNVTGSGFVDIGGGRTYQGTGVVLTGSCSLLNTIPKKITLKLSKSGSPTGIASIDVLEGLTTLHEDLIAHNLGTIDVSTLTTTATEHTFTNLTQNHTIVEGERIAITFTGGTSSDFIYVTLTNSVYAGAMAARLPGANWIASSTQDLVATIYS